MSKFEKKFGEEEGHFIDTNLFVSKIYNIFIFCISGIGSKHHEMFLLLQL